MPYQRRFLPCDFCAGKRALPLGKGDFLECPQCEGTGKIEMVTEVVQARVQERYVPNFLGGFTKVSAILLPSGEWRDKHGTL